MANRGISPGVASALGSIKSILAIVNGLTITNTFLVLITAGHYSEIRTPGSLGVSNVAAAGVLMLNIVPFYHGNMRHIDAIYGAESVAVSAASTPAKPPGGLGVDFLVILAQSLLLSLASFYVQSHVEYVFLFIVLLLSDVVWTFFSPQQSDASANEPTWLRTNLVTAIGLGVLYVIHRGHSGSEWLLDGALVLLAVRAVVDFADNWSIYFPADTGAL
jgi:hypothetical protein